MSGVFWTSHAATQVSELDYRDKHMCVSGTFASHGNTNPGSHIDTQAQNSIITIISQ